MSKPPEAKTDTLLAKILPWAKAVAVAEEADELDISHLLLGACKIEHGKQLLADLLHSDLPFRLEQLAPRLGKPFGEADTPLADRTLGLTPRLKAIVDEEWRSHGMLRARSLFEKIVKALDREPDLGNDFLESARRCPSKGEARAVRVFEEILQEVAALRAVLMERVVGQERAIDQVVDAHFNVLLRDRAGRPSGAGDRGPRAIFTFVGPPGVGKTYLAELLAEHVAGKGGDVPAYLRLDMSGYAAPQNFEQLLGFDTAYRGAREGLLTGFVKRNPEGFILVDEIEKAHRDAQNIFLQILDGGRLYDNHTRMEVDFSRATLIFTTNLGRELYDSPNRAGIVQEAGELNAVVLDALLAEGESRDAERPGFTPELVSRLAKGEAILFQRLDGLALERLAERTVDAVSKELQAASGLAIEVEGGIARTLLLLRFGVDGDARRLQARLRRFLTETVAQVLGDHRSRLIEDDPPLLDTLRGLRLTGPPLERLPAEVAERLEGATHILLFDDDDWSSLFPASWVCHRAERREPADEILRGQRIDFILLDLHIGADADSSDRERGLETLRWLRSRYPEIPVYLFSESPERRGLSKELLDRISLEGGARGVLAKPFFGAGEGAAAEEGAVARDAFLREVGEIDASLRRRALLDHYRRRLKVIDFDLAPALDRVDNGWLPLEMGRLNEVTAVTARDRSGLGWVDLPKERFEDIAGAERAKERLQEVVQWLQDPRPLRDLGIELPRGILLTGPPGTGKTTLARAVAGEAEIPFFAISGSQVFSKWAGEAEAAVRGLFARARRYAPAIVFIDEIDSVGGRRDDNHLTPWRTSVLNELLTQLDGFNRGDRPLFVLAATNRPDTLDPALVRSGRFDLQIEVPNPNAGAREAILEIHLRGTLTAGDVDLAQIAARTAGLSGADLQQVCKEAGLLALREGSSGVAQRHLQEAVTTVRHGLASERVVLDEDARWSTAVHEAGHALAQHHLLPEEPVAQLSILPRGGYLGVTESAPGETYHDNHLAHLGRRVQVLLAARAAEELLLGPDQITAGCAGDLDRASEIAVDLVARFGMDPDFGLLSLPGVEHGLGLRAGSACATSAHDQAITAARAWLAQQKEEVARLLGEHRRQLEALAEMLKERETLYGNELADFFTTQGEAPQSKEA